MINNIINKLNSKVTEKFYKIEDNIPLKFLSDLTKKTVSVKYLEVGSGWGRFPQIIKSKIRNINIFALEINKELALHTSSRGIKTTNGSCLSLPYREGSFDVVHCSHLIEHLQYIDAYKLIDELFRVTKSNGHIIIRSPLMHDRFYQDFDHVKPYPPESIWSYMNLEQQQKQAGTKGKVLKVFYRRTYINICLNYSNNILKTINVLIRYLWLFTGFPSKADSYVMILKKEQTSFDGRKCY